MLAKACKAAGIPAKAIAERRARWTGRHEEMKARLTRTAAEERAKPGISPIALASVAAEVLPADTIFIDETITHMPVMRSYLPLDRAQSFFRITGGALGQGIAAALGIKLAAMERPVVLFVGDGSFLYNPIIQALGASKTYELPIVIVVCNNRRYEAMRKGHVHHYAGGVSDTTNLLLRRRDRGAGVSRAGAPLRLPRRQGRQRRRSRQRVQGRHRRNPRRPHRDPECRDDEVRQR